MNKKCFLILPVLLYLLFHGGDTFAISAQQEVKLRALLQLIAQGDEDEKKAAVQKLSKTGLPEANTILEAYKIGALYIWENRVVYGKTIIEDEDFNQLFTPLDVITQKPLQKDLLVDLLDAEGLEPGRHERARVELAQLYLQLRIPKVSIQIAAVRRLASKNNVEEMLPLLDELTHTGKSRGLRYSAEEGAALIRYKSAENFRDKQEPLNILSDLRSLKAYALIQDDLNNGVIPDDKKKTYQSTLDRINQRWFIVEVFDIFKSALSTGSVLVLMALGLAITFGMMGIINMAHGEMMAIGAYTTFTLQLLFHHSPDTPMEIYYILALPTSFVVSAGFGWLIEKTVVSHLYNRPIESLLATYGISLIISQLIRYLFGDNRATNAPVWLQGAWEVFAGGLLPVNRIFVFILSLAAIALIWAVFNYTNLGLHMRATMQNRAMASAMGINTRKVDSATFMLGSGIAGVAGYALTTIGGITPDMGSNYIVDSFLVVVTGGVGSLAGVATSGFSLGFLNKVLEGTFFGTVWAKIMVLLTVIAFIQYKPSGLFAQKGRLADD